jgi:phage terminase small subunit
MKATGSAYDSLPPKRRLFVDAYLLDPNATKAAKVAGYSKPMQEGHRLLRIAEVQAALQERGQKAERKRIADADEVLEFFSTILRNDQVEPKDRLKAGELLAKRYGLLVEKQEVEHRGAGVLLLPPVVTPKEYQEALWREQKGGK